MDTAGADINADTRATKPIPTVGDKEKQQPKNTQPVSPEEFFSPEQKDYINKGTDDLLPEERMAVFNLIKELKNNVAIVPTNIMSFVAPFGVVNPGKALDLLQVARDLKTRLNFAQLQ